MPSSQEQIGQAIAELKKLFPNKTATERADMVFENPYYLSLSLNGSNGHSDGR